MTGRRRAQRLYPAPLGRCEECCKAEATDRHHKDRDTFNNTRANVQFVCRSCHMRLDEQGERLRAASRRKAELTHCVNGHRFDEANTYQRPRGGRNCRSCARENQARRRAVSA